MDALVEGWISRFGVPADITTDRGTQFTSQVWEKFCIRLGVQHHMTTAYHPASNGLVERAHRQLKDSLRTRLAGNDWPAHLPWILLGLR
ncbi:MAG: DDE-type integrase/transposase/recombinase, partial [bacterium]